ncbi:hypothetical protein C8A01DRAFT_44062 [Parachaetomium inaequale]|uniref:NACHT domain-containing protein n=1 Tax=Parachaetomium inaequale TaxID=2588326 RepID=A0AAN6STY2_9PEZI|nr:hypothetical protein C8A01DRAFT_44062 [Parachaetomium inaequale]
MAMAAARNGSFRHRVRERLNRFRRKLRPSADEADISPAGSTTGDPNPRPTKSQPSGSKRATTSSASSTPPHQGHDNPKRSAATPDDAAGLQVAQADTSSRVKDCSTANVWPSDLWSAAYREAVNGLAEDTNIAILETVSVADLFKQLERIEKDAAQESVFLRGVEYLQSLQVPLQTFKLALDLASPLASIEPTAATVFGMVKGVTAIAISLSTADINFAKQIGEMLEQLSYLDDCDMLGQKANKEDIHKALVLVYQKLLEFYNVAFEMLSRRGVKLAMRMVLENGRLPTIVSDFLRHADHLRKLVEKAIWEIVEDIKAMLYDPQIARWLGSGKMSRQSQHHAYLQELRADQACEFLLKDTTFINWYHATDSQHLAILGDMGSGKSVAMAFLIDELRRRNEHQLPQPKVCYHYCQNGETGQATHIFSALALSLLEQLPGLKRAFFEWYKQTMASGIEPATSFKALEEWLQHTLETLDRPLILAIDGLDECDRQSRNCLLGSLRKLSQRTPRLKVLLSSRPEAEILEQLRGASTIPMGCDAARDCFIAEKTVESRLFYLAKDVKALVTETLSRRAQGSAIWTKVTAELIEIRGIRALGPMRAFLEEIPQPRKLSELYTNLFSRYTSNEPENQRLATAALEILAATRRPLSILELAWAVALGAAREAVPTVDALAKLVDHQRVLSLVQPFVVHVDFSDVTRRQVKLAHQSVKEFIAPVQQRIESLEAGMLDICIRYLLLRDIGRVALFSDEHLAIEELPQDPNLFKDNLEHGNCDVFGSWEAWEQEMIHYDPTERGFGELFVYASCHWVGHFGAVSAEPLLPRRKDIELVCRAGSTGLNNWTAQNCRPDCALKPRFEFHSSLYDPLGVTSLYGSDAMLRHMLEHSDLEMDGFLPNQAMAAADRVLRFGDLSRLALLWGSKIGHQIRNMEFFRLVLQQWSTSPSDKRRPNWDVVFGLAKDVLDKMVTERWGHDLLSLAARTGCLPMVRRLMDETQHRPALKTELLGERSCSKYGPVGEAVLGNHVDVLETLLAQDGIEAHLRHRSPYGENVLHLASRHCNPAVFRRLVPRLGDGVRQRDERNDTVLVRIITSPSPSRDRRESARILLSEVVGGWSEDEQQEAWRVAARLGDLDMCRFLVRFGTISIHARPLGDDGDVLAEGPNSRG